MINLLAALLLLWAASTARIDSSSQLTSHRRTTLLVAHLLKKTMEEPRETKPARKAKEGKRVFRLKGSEQSATRRKTTAHSNTTAKPSDPAVGDAGAGAAGAAYGDGDGDLDTAAAEVRCRRSPFMCYVHVI